MEGINDAQASQIDSREIWREGSSNQREVEPRSESGSSRLGGGYGDLSQRVSREAGPWASLAIVAIGGIFSQLIQDLEDQLAEQDSCIDWYESEIKKNQEALNWHVERKDRLSSRLESIRTQAESVNRALEDSEG
jgi:uncharacterized coiled-coil protein SlyX